MKVSHALFGAVFCIAGILAACGVGGDSKNPGKGDAPTEGDAQSAATVSVSDATSDRKEPVQMSDIPDAIREFVKPGDVLLAYKSMDLTGDERNDTVLVLRRRTQSSPESVYSCDLLVVHGGESPSLASSNGKIVDCEFNDRNVSAQHLDLNDDLELSSRQIKFTNENIRGGSYSYSFRYSGSEWYLSEAFSTYEEDNPSTADIDVYQEVATYPKDFGQIRMTGFDPDMIRDAMSRNKSLVNG